MIKGYHAVYPPSFFAGIDDARDNGFDFVQFDLGVPNFFLDDLYDDEFLSIRDYAKSKNICITFHAPGDNVSLFCDYPFIKRGILSEFKFILDKANLLNARHVTFHSGNYPQFKKSGGAVDESWLSYYEDVFYDNIKYLLKHCDGVLVCMENSDLNALKRKVIQRLIDDGLPLFLTLDTAKLYTKGGELIADDYDFFIRNKARIREIHIHDANAEFGSHQTVGTGYVDFSLFGQFLNENVYLNFEVRPIEAARESKNALKQILPI